MHAHTHAHLHACTHDIWFSKYLLFNWDYYTSKVSDFSHCLCAFVSLQGAFCLININKPDVNNHHTNAPLVSNHSAAAELRQDSGQFDKLHIWITGQEWSSAPESVLPAKINLNISLKVFPGTTLPFSSQPPRASKPPLSKPEPVLPLSWLGHTERLEVGLCDMIESSRTLTKWTYWWEGFLNFCDQGQRCILNLIFKSLFLQICPLKLKLATMLMVNISLKLFSLSWFKMSK